MKSHDMIIWVLSQLAIEFRNIRWKFSRDSRPLRRVTNRIIQNPRQISQIQSSKERQLSVYLRVLMALGWKPCWQTNRTISNLSVEGRPWLTLWWTDRIVTPRIVTLSLSRDLGLSSLTRTPNSIGYPRIRLTHCRESLLPPSILRKILQKLIPILWWSNNWDFTLTRRALRGTLRCCGMQGL
jgi:hypothetical protein